MNGNTKTQLPNNVEGALFGSWLSSHRTCNEKRFARALYAGGVRRAQLTCAGWCGEPLNVDGLIVHSNSIQVSPMCRLPPVPPWKIHGDPLLWAILRHLNIPFSGGAEKHWAQASWLPRPEKERYKVSYWEWSHMSLPMVVLYLNKIVELEGP